MKKPSSHTPDLSKMTKAFIEDIEKRKEKPLYELSPQKARQFLINLQRETVKDIEADIEDKAIYTKDAGSIDLRIIRPQNNSERLPVILYIHGGGWILGNKETHDMLIRKLAVCTNSTVVFPEYTLSPESQYPAAVNQIYAVLNYLYEHPEEFNIDNTRIIVAGDSAGGNMTAVTAIRAKYNNRPRILAQVLLYPVTDLEMDTDSYEEFKKGPWLSKKAMEWFADAYIPDKSKRKDICISPLKATINELSGLPPALIITAENDVLRDEGEMYARKLQEAGNEVLCIRINGTHHDFLMLNALAETIPAKGALEIVCNRIQKVFTN